MRASGFPFCQLYFEQYWFNTSDFDSFDDFNVCSEVVPFDVEDTVESALMELFKETNVMAIGYLGLYTIQDDGQDYCFVNFYFGALSNIVAVPGTG